MKKIKPTIIILIIIPIIIFSSHSYLKNVTSAMSETLNSAQMLAQSGDINGAVKMVDKFNNQWDKYKGVIATFIKHNELDIVNLSAAKLKPLIKNDNKGDFLAECESLKVQLHHIWETEKFSVDNIL
jgi:uncharacterized protein YpmB